MKDVQREKDTRNIPLKNVGIRNLKWPVKLMEKGGGYQQTVATIAMSVDLPHDIRGTHMSRFVEAINEMKSINPKDLDKMLTELRTRLDASVSHCTIEFDYFITKPAPVTGIESPYNVKCCFEAEKGENGEFKFLMEIRVPVSTLCPCSKEISDFGAHNQRAIVHIKVDIKKLVWIEDIVKIAEDSASSPIYSLLKRADEKWVTEQAYLKPRFVEDVVREAAIVLEENSNIRWYSVMVDSIESIHNHDAFAYTEKGCTL
ncbi:MAG: cyclohydrolase FolE2 [Clostridiales bacterium]|nr:cyclohydrolase FolE2 [Clostridiales bacterium]